MHKSRRSFLLQASAGLASLQIKVVPAQETSSRTRLILLGTAGGPTPKKTRSAPAQVIVSGKAAYVVDCGNGVARQLALAGITLGSLRHIFLTHHHSDHNADYGTLLLLAWSSGLRSAVDTWGPPPLKQITRAFFEMSAADIKVRIRDEGNPPLEPLVHVHEVSKTGYVMNDGVLRVRCAAVSHPLVSPALAYRFDGPDRSIVISGDTAPSSDLIDLAHGADVLVHEVLYRPAVDAIAGSAPGSERLKKHLIDSHTSLEDVGRIAAAAEVKTLVLSHFVPSENPPIPDDVWLSGVKANFKGNVVVGRDLLEI